VLGHGTHGCSYLLTVDIEMEPMTGFKLANWEKGFGDFEMRPDLSTLRLIPWQPATVLVLCDLRQHGEKQVAEAPRTVLQRQVEPSKGEWGRGQHEINFIYTEPVPMADRHVLFKQGVKEIAAQQGKAVTFMPKPFVPEPGSSCHIHASFWQEGKNLLWDSRKK